MVERIRLVFIPELFKSSERTLLFFVPRKSPRPGPDSLSSLEATFKMLGDNKAYEIALHQEPYIKNLGGVKVYAYCKEKKSTVTGQRGLRWLTDENELGFRWVCTASEWTRFAHLISGLISNRGGHQYLACDSPEIEDATVMVSSGEYFDEDFKGLSSI